MSFQASSNLTEQIAEHLGWRIAKQQLAAGTRIQELRLAKELSVSRGSVREALLLLAGRYLIDIVPRKGATVRALTEGDIYGFTRLYANLLTDCAVCVMRSGKAKIAIASDLPDVAGIEDAGERLQAIVRCRLAFVDQLLAACPERFLADTLRSLSLAGIRVTYLASAHADFDERDTLRHIARIKEVMLAGSDDAIGELVRAFARREGSLASQVLASR